MSDNNKNKSSGSKEDEVAIRALVDQFNSALNAMLEGDPEPFKPIWSHSNDVVFMDPRGALQVGWDNVYNDWKAQAKMNIGAKCEVKDCHIIVGDDIAVACRVTQQSEIKTPHINLGATHVRETSTFRKENGKWKMITHHVDKLEGFS